MDRCFKGGNFCNRYKITGKLTTLSPLHVGDGDMMIDEKRLPAPGKNDGKLGGTAYDAPDSPDKKEDKKKGKSEVPHFSTVATDAEGRAYIPGSALKGNFRRWLEQIFTDFKDFGFASVNTFERETDLRECIKDIEGAKIKMRKLHTILKTTEYLFGSCTNEGKLEFWDAPMNKPPAIPEQHAAMTYSHYSPKRGTIILKSVAIDPETGTAAKNKLYNYEVVPQGASFNLTISGQNLDDEELGMLLFAMEGFNSMIYPVTIGAMSGIGYGRLLFEMGEIHYLGKENFQEWIEKAVKSGHAGYSGIDKLPEDYGNLKIKEFRESFLTTVKEAA